MASRPMLAPWVTAYALTNALGETTRQVLGRLSAGESGLARCRWELWAGSAQEPTC